MWFVLIRNLNSDFVSWIYFSTEFFIITTALKMSQKETSLWDIATEESLIDEVQKVGEKAKKQTNNIIFIFKNIFSRFSKAIESFCFLFCVIPQVLFKNGISRNCGEITGIMTMLMFSDFF